MEQSEPEEEIHEQARAAPTPPRPLAWLFRGLRIIALIFGGFLVVVYFLQSRMIFPGAATQGSAQSKVHPRNGAELVTLKTAKGERVVALYGAALSSDGKAHPDATHRPSLVYFYGNAMCLNYCDGEFDRFRRLGLNVIIPDYLGYGMSGGKASEVGCRETAESCVEHLRSLGFLESRIIAGGWSLGGAVAIDLASRRQLGGLIAFSTFTSTLDMGRTIFPMTLPKWFFTHRFESLEKISSLRCPILLGHGRQDSLVPFTMFERMLAATRPTASHIIIDEAGHNDFYDLGGRKIFDAVAEFVKLNLLRQ